jgi:hypothetical protein
MTNLRTKTVLVYDYGQYVELAVTLSKQFGRTLYFAPWVDGGNPTSRFLRVGQGFDGVERVEEIWPHIDDVDLFVFADVYEPGLQEYLVTRGKRVWGCRSGAELELDRVASKTKSQALGIDVPPYREIIGFDALRKHLKTHDDQWVKISLTRGDMETFGSPNYAASEQLLDKLEHDLGPKKKIMQFVVESGVNDAVEIGYDGYTVDGKFPNEALVGLEVKGKAYAGCARRYQKLPEQVRSVNEKLAPALKRYKSRCFMSTEIRCNKDGAFLIDPCMRCGSPPSELYQVMIENLGEIAWEGSDGILVDPDFRAKCGAMAVIKSEWATENWQHVSFPPSIREQVKLHNATVLNGEYYVIPHTDGRSQIGAVIGMGDTMRAAIDDCKKAAEQIKGHDIEIPLDALDQARKKLEEALGQEKEPSKLERKADALRKAGKISAKQYDRMIAGA